MTSSLWLSHTLSLSLCLAGALAACSSDPGTPPPTTDLGIDASAGDLGTLDAATPDDGSAADDAAAPDDAAPGDDAAVDAGDTDAGPAPDSGVPSTCDPALGAPCDTGTPCASGFECNIGRCAPQARDLCGGFAGAMCPRTVGSPYTECLYYTSADFGPCLTPAERACICARAIPGWLVCP